MKLTRIPSEDDTMQCAALDLMETTQMERQLYDAVINGNYLILKFYKFLMPSKCLDKTTNSIMG